MQTIAEICHHHLLNRKWLIVPSMRTGTSWLEHAVRAGVSCVNVTPVTVQRFAFELAACELAESGRSLISNSLGALIVQSSWNTLPPEGYFRTLNPTSGLFRAIASAVEDLRLHNIANKELLNSTTDESAQAKSVDLSMLLDAWQNYLDKHNLADRATILQLAIDVVTNGELPSSDLVLLHPHNSFSGLERQLMSAVPDDQVIEVESPLLLAAEDEDEDAFGLGLFRAIGEVNEVREVFRRCVDEEFPLDCVEILHTDAATYVPLVLEIASLIDHADGQLPVTFADGLPVSMSHPIKALRAWLRWCEADFAQPLLVEMLADGLLETKDFSGPALARILRPLGIKTGSQHYLPKLKVQSTSVKTQIARLSHSTDPEDQLRVTRLQLKQQRLKFLTKLIDQLICLADAIHGEDSSLALSAAVDFLAKYAKTSNEFDAVARNRVAEEIREHKTWLEVLNLQINVGDWLESLCRETTVSDSGPRPGAVHVASLANGGQSGRPMTFVVGMDDRRFPGAMLQDPILLDAERRSLSNDFATSVGRLESKISNIQQTLNQLRGELTVSWSCLSIADGSEMFASSLAHKLGRMMSGLDEADWDTHQLNKLAGIPVSFAANASEPAFTESDRLVGTLCDIINPAVEVYKRFPHLKQGANAQRSRLAQFGEYSGRVSAVANRVDPFSPDGPVYSASALETLGRCPLAFFFSRRLHLFPPDEPDDNLDRWLDAAQFGNLLHELFRRFMSGLPTGELPVFDSHWNLLRQHLKDIVEQHQIDIPAANESAVRRDLSRLIRIARTFLREEEANCAAGGITPLYFEAAVGMSRSDADTSTPLDTVEPVFVQLGRNKAIRTRGQIDRVDRISENVYSVCDYKTGSAFGYSAGSPFSKGRKVQNVLYLKMVQTVLRQKIHQDARVARFEYFFPGTKANGLRQKWSALDLEPGVHVLDTLCSLDAAALYPPTNDKDDCRFCDFNSVCCNLQAVTRSGGDFLYRESDLADLKDVRND